MTLPNSKMFYTTAVALTIAMLPQALSAYESADLIVRGGAAMVNPQDDSSTLRLNGASIPGTSVSVDDNTQLGLTLTYMFNSSIGIELLAATPFSHTVTAHGLGPDLKAADVKHLPPTVSLQFFPMDGASAFQPYVGVGLNYTVFFDEELTSDFVAALGDGSIELDPSTGLAVELGFDIAISDKLVFNAAVWKAAIDTTATIELDAGGVIEVDVDIDPIVYMISLGYKF